jgi:hypothetical protein
MRRKGLDAQPHTVVLSGDQQRQRALHRSLVRLDAQHDAHCLEHVAVNLYQQSTWPFPFAASLSRQAR